MSDGDGEAVKAEESVAAEETPAEEAPAEPPAEEEAPAAVCSLSLSL